MERRSGCSSGDSVLSKSLLAHALHVYVLGLIQCLPRRVLAEWALTDNLEFYSIIEARLPGDERRSESVLNIVETQLLLLPFRGLEKSSDGERRSAKEVKHGRRRGRG